MHRSGFKKPMVVLVDVIAAISPRVFAWEGVLIPHQNTLIGNSKVN